MRVRKYEDDTESFIAVATMALPVPIIIAFSAVAPAVRSVLGIDYASQSYGWINALCYAVVVGLYVGGVFTYASWRSATIGKGGSNDPA